MAQLLQLQRRIRRHRHPVLARENLSSKPRSSPLVPRSACRASQADPSHLSSRNNISNPDCCLRTISRLRPSQRPRARGPEVELRRRRPAVRRASSSRMKRVWISQTKPATSGSASTASQPQDRPGQDQRIAQIDRVARQREHARRSPAPQASRRGMTVVAAPRHLQHAPQPSAHSPATTSTAPSTAPEPAKQPQGRSADSSPGQRQMRSASQTGGQSSDRDSAGASARSCSALLLRPCRDASASAMLPHPALRTSQTISSLKFLPPSPVA